MLLSHTIPSLVSLTDFEQALKDAVMATCPDGPPTLRDALVHAVLKGGKRIRPLLCLAGGQALGVELSVCLPVAVATELVHAQSLVHDDLPCMDNDEERRGLPTVHKAFGEATAVLVGDALLAHAFAVLAKPHPKITPINQALLVFELSHTYQRLVSGQLLDLQYQQAPDAALLPLLHRLKTAALFRYCFWAIATLSPLPAEKRQRWSELGQQIGLLFQVCDDILDDEIPSVARGALIENAINEAGIIQNSMAAEFEDSKPVQLIVQRIVNQVSVQAQSVQG